MDDAPPQMTPASGEPDWKDPPRRPVSDGGPILSVEGFEGPLDWLVEQVRAGGIDPQRLSIVALVDAFAKALDAVLAGADKRPTVLARWSAWLVMAADLTLLRSRLLLPTKEDDHDAAADEAEALRDRIQRRADLAAAADWLERRDQFGRDVWGRGYAEEGRAATGRVGDITGLLRACLVALQLPHEAEAAFRVALPLWSVADAAVRIRAMLSDLGEGGAPLYHFLPEVTKDEFDYALRCRAAVASTFFAGLEMVRGGLLATEQPEAFETLVWSRQ